MNYIKIQTKNNKFDWQQEKVQEESKRKHKEFRNSRKMKRNAWSSAE